MISILLFSVLSPLFFPKWRIPSLSKMKVKKNLSGTLWQRHEAQTYVKAPVPRLCSQGPWMLLPHSNGCKELFALIPGGYIIGANHLTSQCLNSNLWNGQKRPIHRGLRNLIKIYKGLLGFTVKNMTTNSHCYLLSPKGPQGLSCIWTYLSFAAPGWGRRQISILIFHKGRLRI